MTTTVGVDIGGTKILAGVVDDEGNVLSTVRKPTPRNDAAACADVIVAAVAEVRAEYDIVGVGLGVAGLIDAHRSAVLFAPNLDWSDLPLQALVEPRVGAPVVVENDGNAAAWGEFCFGAGRDADDMVMITVGTGIGGGIVLNGALRRGAIGVAGEIGHMNAIPDGYPCGCGRFGCWEQYASGNALVRQARQLATERRSEASLLLSLGDGTPEGVQGKHISQAAASGDPVAIAAFALVGNWLGRGMSDLAAVLDPELFVIGGGVSEAGDVLLSPAREVLAEKIIGKGHRNVPAVRAATLGNTAGLIGVANLALSV